MPHLSRTLQIVCLFATATGWVIPMGCVTTAAHPCTQGSQTAHDDGSVGKGTKQCLQIRDSAGGYLNQGKYVEWYPNGVRAMEGDYLAGVKTGKWTEWDDKGRKVAEKWYENGQLVPGREDKPYNGLTPPPRPAASASAH